MKTKTMLSMIAVVNLISYGAIARAGDINVVDQSTVAIVADADAVKITAAINTLVAAGVAVQNTDGDLVIKKSTLEILRAKNLLDIKASGHGSICD